MVLSGEQGLALEHFGEDAACAPDIDFHVVLLPGEHDLRCSVVARRNVSSHLRILYTGQTKITNLKIAVLINEDVARLQVSVHDSGGVDVFQTTLAKSAKASRREQCHLPESGKESIE